ncbi:MAG: hypothetical protein ABIP48_19100, partial [Planctomycetota bacterium]
LSKYTLITPVLMIVLMQWMLERRLFSRWQATLLVALLLLIYPFLGEYRSFAYRGEPGLLGGGDFAIDRVMFERGYLDVLDLLLAGVLSILGRLVGFDSLITLIRIGGKPFGLIDYLASSTDVDSYLTYQIIGYVTPMGISPGMLGRFYYISGSHVFVFFASAALTWFLAIVARIASRHVSAGGGFAVILVTISMLFFVAGPRVPDVVHFSFALSSVWMIVAVVDRLPGLSRRPRVGPALESDGP